MSITHPRQLPDSILAECTFTLDDGLVEARHAKGLAGTITALRAPMWTVKVSTGEMMPQRRAAWEAWKNSLQGRAFLMWDVSRPQPLAYPNGIPSLPAFLNVTALTTDTISLSGLPASYVVTEGDRIGLVQGGRYGYYEILADVTASGGGAATVTVAPRVNPATTAIFTTAASAVLRRPLVMVRMTPGSWSLAANAYAVAATFEAVQVL